MRRMSGIEGESGWGFELLCAKNEVGRVEWRVIWRIVGRCLVLYGFLPNPYFPNPLIFFGLLSVHWLSIVR